MAVNTLSKCKHVGFCVSFDIYNSNPYFSTLTAYRELSLTDN